MKKFFVLFSMIILLGCAQKQTAAVSTPKNQWQFVVSGDSRNCGDVVLPEIAKGTHDAQAQFYWHLGDFRAMVQIDEDLAHDPLYSSVKSLEQYHQVAWNDFIHNQLEPFGKTPVYLGIGNHETVKKTREEYLSTFKPWLGGDRSKTYFHWVQNGVDFITLDNASDDQFDATQLKWFLNLIKADETDSKVKTIVVGMHKALPDSISFGHSMSESKNPVSVISGREAYHALLKAKGMGKNVYVLASHSHFFMDGTFNTEYWKKHGGILPGWIIGTAGAMRYALPEKTSDANQAKTNVYGYLLATVDLDHENRIQFEFKEIYEADVLETVNSHYGKELVHFCFDKNHN